MVSHQTQSISLDVFKVLPRLFCIRESGPCGQVCISCPQTTPLLSPITVQRAVKPATLVYLYSHGMMLDIVFPLFFIS